MSDCRMRGRNMIPLNCVDAEIVCDVVTLLVCLGYMKKIPYITLTPHIPLTHFLFIKIPSTVPCQLQNHS
jgi:hypothetical protein